MEHPYAFFTSLSKLADKLPPLVKPVADPWLDAFWRPDLFDKFKNQMGNSNAALAILLKLNESGVNSASGMLRFWTYDLVFDSEVNLGWRQAALLVAHAINTLRKRDESTKKIIKAYFGDEKGGAWGLAVNQFEGLRNALMLKFFVVMNGEKAKDSLAYVDTKDDYDALYKAKGIVPDHRYKLWYDMHRCGNIGFVSVRERLFEASPSADRGSEAESTVSRPAEEQAMRVGVTLVHEISHLFAHERTDDVGIAMIDGKSKKEELEDFRSRNGVEMKLDGRITECYGRVLCRALARSRPLFAYKNADTLAFFALDAWLLQRPDMSLDAILKLP